MGKIILFAGLLFSMMSFHVTAQNTREKTLVVFFSQTGNTRSVGKAIQELAGGDLFELKVVEPYPDDYHAIRVRAKAEQEKDVRPELISLPQSIYNIYRFANMELYDSPTYSHFPWKV